MQVDHLTTQEQPSVRVVAGKQVPRSHRQDEEAVGEVAERKMAQQELEETS